jgi:serine/threonine protein kinase
MQPAMDVYSLGVLLFVMLVGRKPWDAQRSHTLAYAVQRTSEAPGLHDPVFLGLSAPAQQLLAWMLAEEPSRRPTAQQVLGHSWVLQGGVCKVRRLCADIQHQQTYVCAHARHSINQTCCVACIKRLAAGALHSLMPYIRM